MNDLIKAANVLGGWAKHVRYGNEYSNWQFIVLGHRVASIHSTEDFRNSLQSLLRLTFRESPHLLDELFDKQIIQIRRYE